MNRNKSILLVFLLNACNPTAFSGGGSKSPAVQVSPAPQTAGSTPATRPAKPTKPDAPATSADPTTAPPPAGSLAAYVADATNKNPVAGATIKIDALGVNCTTDAAGQCNLAGVDLSPQSVEASASGYIAQTQQRAAGDTILRFVLSPELADGQTRFVLTWGANPADLDSHLFATRADGSKDHIWFANPKGTSLDLDVDSVNGYGPETVTLRTLAPGHYEYKVIDYTHSGEEGSVPTSGGIADATVLVRLYIKGQPSREFRPSATGVGLVWNVLRFDIDAAGQITVHENGAFSNDAATNMEDRDGGGTTL